MIIDQPIPAANRRQFSSQVKYLSTEEIEDFEKNWTGEQTDDIYKGMLMGLVVAHQLMNAGHGSSIGPLISFVADKMEQKEIP